MKSSHQKTLSIVSHQNLPAGLMAIGVASLGMMCPVLAQQAPAPPPPPPPQAAMQQPALPPPPSGGAQLTNIHGTVSQYVMNPDGLVDGLLLSDNTIVRF